MTNNRKQADTHSDFAFFEYLRLFYRQNRREIRSTYKLLSKKFLDFNDPSNVRPYSLRIPQFEALETYIFLKEFLDNAPVHRIFEDWYKKSGEFAQRAEAGILEGQGDLFGTLDENHYKQIFSKMQSASRVYPNYIFALTMGTGKTILMATCIFYEFLLSNKYPDDPRYCHNALVFAPDKTVLQSLKEIQTFDKSRVVPPEYVSWLDMHLRIEFLEEAGTTLNIHDRSRFNIIISNTQKIILKKQHKEKSLTEKLFSSSAPKYDAGSVYEQAADLWRSDSPASEDELTTNQRFLKLSRLEQLGIYVDEAHHAFGSKLADDLGMRHSKTSLRITIDELATNLKRAGSRVVACYNYTGTPYIEHQVMPEVVYAFGLKEAIDKEYLKKVRLNGYTNPTTREFVKAVIMDFWEKVGKKGKTYEGLRPKLAFFAPTINELTSELRPAIERVLAELGIPTDKILTNTGDSNNDDLREFNLLDTPKSKKQIVLLVNKGKEGWNCRSLFGVALFRRGNSKIFVLQATMRCMRSIGNHQETANIYLSDENLEILDEELQQNFRLGTKELQASGTHKRRYQIRVVPPPVKIEIRRVRHHHELKEKKIRSGIFFDLKSADVEKYKLKQIIREGVSRHELYVSAQNVDLTHLREKRVFSQITLVAEISRYLNCSCIKIEEILRDSKEGIEEILEAVNKYNELLYDWIIPKLFSALYEIKTEPHEEPEIITLVNEPEKGYFEVSADPELVVKNDETLLAQHIQKSFHLDTYCFDSSPEKRLFWDLIMSGQINQVYFTGMLTHGQSDFCIYYIDPESHTMRSYYPDFLMKKNDETWVIVEVKGDDKIDDPIVKAKEAWATQLAKSSLMSYKVIKGSDAMSGKYYSIVN